MRACLLRSRDLSRSTDILDFTIFSHHVSLATICRNFSRGSPIRARPDERSVQTKKGLSRAWLSPVGGVTRAISDRPSERDPDDAENRLLGTTARWAFQ